MEKHKKFEIFLLYAFKLEEKDMHSIYVRYSDSFLYFFKWKNNLQLNPIANYDKIINQNGEDFIIRIMWASCDKLDKDIKFIRLFLKTDKGVEYEEQEKKQRDISNDQPNFIFNAVFLDNPKERYKTPPKTLPLITSYQLLEFISYTKNENPGKYLQKLLKDSIPLCDTLNVTEMDIYLTLLSEAKPYEKLILDILIKFKINLLIQSPSSLLENYSNLIEFLQAGGFIKKIEERKNTKKNEKEKVFNSDWLKFIDNYNMLILGYFLKINKIEMFIEWLNKLEKEQAEKLLWDFTRYSQFFVLDKQDIFQACAIFGENNSSSKFIMNLISLSKDTPTKMEMIFDDWEKLAPYLTSKDKLYFIQMLNKGDLIQENIPYILSKIEEKYLYEEDLKLDFSAMKLSYMKKEKEKINIKNFIDILIIELLKKFVVTCEDLDILSKMKTFLVKHFNRIYEAGKNEVKFSIQRKMNERVTSYLNEGENSYLESLKRFQFLSKNFGDLLMDRLDDHFSNQKIIKLVTSFEISDVEDILIKQFQEINFQKLFSPRIFKDFVETICAKCKQIQDLLVILNLFPTCMTQQYSNDLFVHFHECLIKTYSRLLLNNPSEDMIIEIYLAILNSLSTKNQNLFVNLFKKLIEKLDFMQLEDFLLLHIKLIEMNESPEILECLFTCLAEKMKNLLLRTAYKLMNRIFHTQDLTKKIDSIDPKQGRLCFLIVENLRGYIPKEEDFYEKEIKDNLRFLFTLIQSGLFSSQVLKESLFILCSTKLLNKIKSDLIDQKLKIDTFLFLKDFSKEELSFKIRLLCMDMPVQYIQIQNSIQSSLKYAHEIKASLVEVLFYLKVFFKDIPEMKSQIDALDQLKVMIREQSLFDILKSLESVIFIQEHSKYAKMFIDLSHSEIFFSMLKKEKTHEQTMINEPNGLKKRLASLNICYERFALLKNILKKETLGNYNARELNEIFEDIKDKESALKEILFLKKYFDMENCDTNYVEKTLQVLCTRNQIVEKIRNVRKILEIFAIKHSKFIEKLEKDKDDLIRLDVNAWDYIESYNKMINYGFDFVEDNEFFHLIEILVASQELIQFLEGKREDDIRGLVEFVDDIGDSFIKVESIRDLIKVLGFIIVLRSDNESLVDLDFLRKFWKLTKVKSYVKIAAYIHSVIENINGIKQLYTKIVNREEFSKIKIKEIYHSSIFELVQYQKEFGFGYHIKVSYGDNYKKKCEFDEIIELRDRSLLLSKKKIVDKSSLTEGQNFDEEENVFIQICKNFYLIVDEVLHLLDDVNELYVKGYPKSFLMRICVNRETIYVETGNEKRNLEDIKDEIQIILRRLNEELISAYENCPLMTFFYGRQFQIIYDYILRAQNSKEVKTFVRYISNHLITSLEEIPMINDNDNNNNNDNDIRAMFETVNAYITQCLRHNAITWDMILKANEYRLDYIPGIYCYLVSEFKLEFEVLNAYMYLTKNIPLFHTVLICNESTSKEQIISFIYRSITFPHRIPFFILKSDCIDLEKRMEITNQVKQLHSNFGNQMKSILVFVYSDKSSDLIEQIKKIKGWKNLTIEQNDKGAPEDYLKTFVNNVEVVCSDASGVGKSCFIKHKAIQSGFNYLLFPLGGEITWNNIITRLKEIQFNEDPDIKTVLHVDVSDTSNMYMMRDFLFSFLITGGVSVNDELFILNKNVMIEIELPFGFVNFLQKFPILTLFNIINITKSNPPKMIIPSDVKSNVQIIANYLHNYDTNAVKNHNIYISCNCDGNNHNEACLKHKSVSLVSFSEDQCSGLIFRHFDIKHPTYYQITSFVNVLADQFNKLSHNIYFDVDQLQNNGEYKRQNLLDCRPLLIKSLIGLTKYFTTGAYGDLIMCQDFTYQKYGQSNPMNVEYDIEKDNQRAIALLENKQIITFDKIPYSLVFFNEDGQSISIITTVDRNTEEYKILSYLWSSGRIDNAPLIDYRALDHMGFIEEVSKVLCRGVTLEQTEGYVFTADNFIKMLLILLRVRAKIPVIMMGETGCGKTSLIRMISKLKGNTMKILNIHAGISDDQIIHFMNEQVVPYSKSDEQIWVFLDEINTCNSMGLISEIMCKHTMQGIQLPSNITFIAACNPYRRITNYKSFDTGLVNKKEHLVRHLVYSVNPLPHSLLNFVFDFGNLTLTDEKRYIESMLKMEIKSEKYLQLAVNAIVTSQNFIRALNEVSSVSLRDVRRFVIFYQWFIRSIRERKKITTRSVYKYSYSYYENIEDEDILFRAIVLSIFICYYLRIPDKKVREDFKDNLILSFQKDKKHVDKEEIDKIFEEEQMDVVQRIHPPKGIALNIALLENLFTLFVCINNKIPVLLCGKPGCSKTLSVQLLYSSMRGQDSTDEFFRKLPRLFMNCYQGSMTSTSAGVLKVFEKARNILKDENSKDLISMIFFDEMGLAEISRNNPLKVIHSELEYDQNNEKVAFVGISNWKLDASKMNRGIFLSRPDPDEEDLIKTAITIAKSYQDELILNNEYLFKALAQTYFKYKLQLKERMKDKEDFHGTRDFYNLIKQVSRRIIDPNKTGEYVDKYTLETFSIDALERNFGGLDNSIEMVKKIFTEVYPNCNAIATGEYDVMNCIRENVLDEQSRYLILISKSSISPYLLDSILDSLKIDYSFYIGSKLANDIDHEDYSFKILNQVQICMEQGKMLILKNLEMIYPSLYDLFNQNFNRVGGKNYARIALGISNNPMAFVNERFRCVILLDQNELSGQDPPFLNRFEKHIISFEYLLSENYIKLAKEISNILKKLILPCPGIKVAINLSAQMVNCDDEEILGMIYQCMSQKITNPDKITSYVLSKIVPTFSQDVIASSKISSYNTKSNKELLDLIYQIYIDKGDHRSLEAYLNTADNTKHVVYTFSSILDSFEIGYENIHNTIVGDATIANVEEVTISTFKSESELDLFLTNFHKDPHKKICIMKFRIVDLLHMNLVKFLIDNIQKENEYPVKIIIFTVHLFRIMDGEKITSDILHRNKDLISHLANYNQIFIDNLNNRYPRPITDLLSFQAKDFFYERELFDFEEAFRNQFYQCLMKIMYNFINGEPQYDYRNVLIEKLFANRYICNVLKQVLFEFLSKKCDVIGELLTTKKIAKRNADLISMIQMYLNHIFEVNLAKLIVNLERAGAIEFCVDLNDESDFDKFLVNIWTDLVKNINLAEINVNNNNLENEVEKIIGLKIPFLQKEIYSLLPKIKEFYEDYYNLEENLRNSRYEITEIDENLAQFKKDQNDLVASVVREFDKSELFKRLRDRDTKSVGGRIFGYEMVLHDYIKYFIGMHAKANDEEKEKFIYMMLNLKFKRVDYIDPYDYLGNIIIWLEAHTTTIQAFIRGFDNLSKFHNNIVEELSILLHNKTIFYPFIDPVRLYKKEINEIFFMINDGLIHISLPVKTLLDKMNVEEFYEYINIMKNIAQESANLEVKLWLYSKELAEIQNFLKFESIAERGLNPITIKDLLHPLVEIKQKENLIIREKEGPELEDALITLLEEQFRFFQISLAHNKEQFPGFLCEFFVGKFKKISNEKYRLKMLKILLNEEEFTKNSKNFMELSLRKFFLTPDSKPKGANENENKYENEVQGFCSFASEEDLFLEELEKDERESLDEILQYIIENKILKYFDQISKEEDTIYNLSLKYFEKSINHLEAFYNNENPYEYLYTRLAVMYSISYIKIYIGKYAKILSEKNDQYDFSDINTVICGNGENPVRRMVKLFILKCLRLQMPSYEALKNFDFILHQARWISEFSFEEVVPSNLDSLFLSVRKFEQYQDLVKQFMALQQQRFRTAALNEEIKKKTSESNLSLLIDVTINQILSNTISPGYLKKPEFNDYSQWMTHFLGGIQCSENTKKILYLFNSNDFVNKIHPLLLKSQDTMEMLFHAYKLASACFNADQRNFYGHLTNIGDISDNFASFFLPGGENEEIRLVQTYKEISDYLNKFNNISYGAYVCSCGLWYEIGPCGSPCVVTKCAECQKDIGGVGHVLVKRDGHYRVYKDIGQKNEVFKWAQDQQNNSKLLEDVKQEIDRLINNQTKGYKKVSYFYFANANKIVRNLNSIAYRFLSFIIYAILFYGNLTGLIQDDIIAERVLIEKTPLLETLELLWKLLKSLLASKGINDISIFLNLVYDDIITQINDFPIITTPEDRLAFEDRVNVICDDVINKYSELSVKYKEISNAQLQSDFLSLKPIIHEKEDPKLYDPKLYPYMKYFRYATYPSEEDLKNKLFSIKDYEKQYPVLSNFINQKGTIEKLENLLKINPLVNYMIKHYSYKISRPEAKEKIIKDELMVINDEYVDTLFNNFKEGWDNIYKSATKFLCRPVMEPKEITKQDALSHVLNDNGELCHGMYLAAGYQNFIIDHNSIIKNILANISQSGIASYYKDSLSKQVIIQDALPAEILSLELEGEFVTISDFAKYFSFRNIFNPNGMINLNYNRYKEIVYSFDNIEEELAKIILPGKKLFSENQKFITFAFEAYRGEKSAILNTLAEKIPQDSLVKEEKDILSLFSEEFKSIDKFFVCLQTIIFYLHKTNFPGSTPISLAIHRLPNYITVGRDISVFFESNQMLTISKLVEIYEYVELLCYNKILDNVNDDYKMEIPQDVKKKVNEHFEQNQDVFITKKILSTGIRKFISRFLSGKLGIEEIKANEHVLFFVQYKPDLWSQEIFNDERFTEEMDKLIALCVIKVNQAVQFYQILGGDQDLIVKVPKKKDEVKDLPPKKAQGKKKGGGGLIY